MKKLFIIPLVLFSITLMSFSSTENTINEEEVVSACTSYCTGYADGMEAASKVRWTTEQWMQVYNNCLNTASVCED